jgi:DNA-binding NtrC family response regulator
MQHLLSLAQRLTQSDTSTLILGETGVGKEWLARAIHEEGPRSQGPFVAVNCGGIPETLLESELYGHEEGAFTGASRARRGHFEMAHGGTVFLDEIAEMPNHLQVKLMRVLQERKIQRLGSEKEIELDVRIIAATNKNPEDEIREKRLRSDLYYRIGVVTLLVPPLRERREDIQELVSNYLRIHSAQLRRDIESVEPEAMHALRSYDWPGNVRELINVIERAVLLARGPRIGISDLPHVIGAAAGGSSTSIPICTVLDDAGKGRLIQKPLRIAKREVVSSFEKAYLSALLKETHGRIGETAKLAGITPRALYEKMRNYGLRKEDYGASRE